MPSLHHETLAYAAAAKSKIDVVALTQKWSEWKNQILEASQCHVCYALLYEPSMLPCNHVRHCFLSLPSNLILTLFETFCLSCIRRCQDHSLPCPLCRAALSNDNTKSRPVLLLENLREWAFLLLPPYLLTMHHVVKILFPTLVSERQLELANTPGRGELDEALFVCTLAFPDMPCPLIIFEPRFVF